MASATGSVTTSPVLSFTPITHPNCYEVCQSGDFKKLKEMIEQDPSLIRFRHTDGSNLMHAAASQGHVAIAQWLHSLDPDLITQVNQHNQTPLDLGLRGLFSRETTVSAFKQQGDLCVQQRELDRALEAYTKALHEAEKKKDNVLIADVLKDLGKVFLEKREWTKAAKIFNGAYFLHPQDPESLSLMVEVERRFLKQECSLEDYPDRTLYATRRLQLSALRQKVRQGIKTLPAEKILETFSSDIAQFLEELLKGIYPLLGKPPCAFALIGLGSLARKEMSPFSDLEFAILIEKKSPEITAYFHKLVKLLEIRVINLGETEIKILDHGFESPTPRGFSFDNGGNTPLGKAGYVELLDTPQALAQYQSERFYSEDLILSNVLKSTGVLVGSVTLHRNYLQAMGSVLDRAKQQSRALHIIQNHLLDFEPRTDRQKEEKPFYNIKEELYRLPSFLIAALADYHGIDVTNTWDKLDELARRKILGLEAVKNLKEAMSATLHLRIRAHLHYQKENDDAYHPVFQKKHSAITAQLKHPFTLSDSDIDTIVKIYRVLFPLHRVFKAFCQTRDFGTLFQQTFYDDSLLAQGEAYKKLCLYAKAKECLQKAAALNPKDVEAQHTLSEILRNLAEYAEASRYAQKALVLSQEKKDESLISRALNQLGVISQDLGDSKKAIDLYTQALEIARRLYGDEHPEVATSLNNLSGAWKALGDAQKAIGFYEEALRIGKKVYGNDHPSVATSLNNLGEALRALGDTQKAIGFYEEALRIFKKVYGNDHPSVATSLNNLGGAWQVLGDAQKAIGFYEEALRIDRKFLGNDHPSVATSLSNLGGAWEALGNAQKAIGFYEEALRIFKKVNGNDHPSVAIDLNNLGAAWEALGDAQKAIGFYEEALRIFKKVYGNDHPSVATSLSNHGEAWRALGDAQKAIGFYEEALRIFKKVNGNDHPSVATCLNNLGLAWEALGDAQKAIGFLEEALRIDKKVYGNDHPSVAAALNNLGAAWEALGDVQKAIGFYVEALRIGKKVYGNAAAAIHQETSAETTILMDASEDGVKSRQKSSWCCCGGQASDSDEEEKPLI